MASLLAMLLTLVTLGQAWVAYMLCFEASGLGGYGPFAIMTLPMVMLCVFLSIRFSPDSGGQA